MMKLSKKHLHRFWGSRLPNQEQLFERFTRIGLLPQDFKLTHLELVCACSLMLEHKTLYDVYQSIEHLNNECTKSKFDDAFFHHLEEIISEMDMVGMRVQARKLRKLGQGIASTQRKISWQSYWKKEADKKLVSSIRDEPFLPQQG
jgi:hypothetical protein